MARDVTRGMAIGMAAVAIAACAAPFVVSDYHLFQLTQTLVYAIALIGLNLLTGYNGQISLGHGAFFAMGAYMTAILAEQAHVPYWMAVPLAGLVCFVAGFLFGLPALRLEGHYLALATYALGVAMPQILKHPSLETWTGGAQGVAVTRPDAPSWVPLSSERWFYFFTLLYTVVLTMFARNLLAGRIGRAIIAIRDQPVAAEAMGIHASRYKATTFGISVMYTGIAGGLGALVVQFIAPDSFPSFLSISLLVGVVVGGLSSMLGAFLGAVFIQFIPNVAEQVSKAAPWAIYGAVLIGCMYVMPSGAAGLVRRLLRRRRAATGDRVQKGTLRTEDLG